MATQKSTKSLLEVFVQEMRIRNYSPKSISSYLGVLKAFIRYCHPKHPKDLTIDEIHGYLHHLIETKEVSRSTIDQTISSLKFLYNKLYNKNFSSRELPRPKKETKLPVVLSKKEIQAIISSTSNFKYKTMIELMYGSGLRISEVVKLKVQDFDLDRLTIMLHAAKEKKIELQFFPQKLYQK